jgi:hypothetical protein
MAAELRGEVRIERRSGYDAQGRARWLVQWSEGALARGQVWFGEQVVLLGMLARSGFDLRAVQVEAAPATGSA